MAKVSVTIEGLAKTFGRHTALAEINLEIHAGELVTLLGPSGCGKTTLLRCIAGIAEIERGEVRFDGRVVNNVVAERRNVGMVFQSYALFPHMTVFKNVAFGLQMRRVPREKARRRIEDALKLVELEGYADRYPRQLSGGQQQRVALARAIVVEPDLLLFDEPLSNLDAKLRETLRDDLRRLQRRLGTTSIYVTHDQSEAMALADRIVVMRNGRVVEEGTPEKLYRHPRYRYTAEFLGNTNVVEARVDGDDLLLPWGLRRPARTPLPAMGQMLLVSLRPEDIGLVPRPPGTPTTAQDGVVAEMTFMGSEQRYIIKIGELPLRVTATGSTSAALALGSRVSLVIPPTLHVLQDHVHDQT